MLHKHGMIYRGLEPEHVIICEDGYVKLKDFKLAKEVYEAQQVKGICGSEDYRAPEMVSNADYSFGLDWWTTGILAYEMVVGRKPFDESGPDLS